MDFIEEAGRIYAKDEIGKIIAEVTFPDMGNNTVNLNHTFVDSSLRGQGIADKLVTACADKIRNENKKIYPTCSYAVSWFNKHSEYSDILKNEQG